MVLLEFSEYHYFDDVLSDLKLTPVSIDCSWLLLTVSQSQNDLSCKPEQSISWNFNGKAKFYIEPMAMQAWQTLNHFCDHNDKLKILLI